MPSATNSEYLQDRLAKSSTAGPLLGKPNGIWWPNHQSWGRTRDLSTGPDMYRLHNATGSGSRELANRPCLDSRYRDISAVDISNQQKFGPTARDFEAKRVPPTESYEGLVFKSHPSWASHPVRLQESEPWRNWELDKYKLHGRTNITNSDPTRKATFDLYSEPRFCYKKLFGRDFTRTGASLNASEKSFVPKDKSPQQRRRKRDDVPVSALTSAAAAGAACRAVSRSDSSPDQLAWTR